MEDLITGNPLEFCKRWLSLAGVQDMISDIVEYQTSYPSFSALDINTAYREKIRPFAFLDNNEQYKPIEFMGNENEAVKLVI